MEKQTQKQEETAASPPVKDEAGEYKETLRMPLPRGKSWLEHLLHAVTIGGISQR